LNLSRAALGNKTVHMTDDSEIAWHREQIAKNRTLLQELEAGNTGGDDVFPECLSKNKLNRQSRL
jgi:hypothetical protein